MPPSFLPVVIFFNSLLKSGSTPSHHRHVYSKDEFHGELNNSGAAARADTGAGACGGLIAGDLAICAADGRIGRSEAD